VSDLFSSLAQWTVEVIYSLGYSGVAILMALSNLFVPIPSELVLPLAGFLVDQELFSFPLVFLAATAGPVASALVLYALGHWLDEERLRRFVKRFGRFALVGESDLDKASGWFERHGTGAVLVGRLVPGVGSLISIPAGIGRMPLSRFVACTVLGNGLWNGAFIGLGWTLGDRWALAQQYAQPLQYALLAAAAGGVFCFFLRRRRRAHR
jgi:membrane protein DedA with SNARE-associated domain